MNEKTFAKVRLATTLAVNALVVIGILLHNVYIALVGVAAGLVFLWIMRRRTKAVLVDERVEMVANKAARATFVYSSLVFGLTALFLFGVGRLSDEPEFFNFIDALGLLFAFVTMFLLLVYAVTYKYFDRSYGADNTQ